MAGLRERAHSDDYGSTHTPNTLARSTLSAGPPGTESHDFDLHESKQYIEYVTKITKAQRKWKGGIRWVLIISTGILTALTAVCIDIMVKHFFAWRLGTAEELRVQGYGAFTMCLANAGFCVGLASVAGFLVCWIEPLAAGSGIPEVKCFLNGVSLPRIVDFKTLIAKAPGVMFSVAAGLPCGKEGPMIHSGAVVGGVLSRLGTGPLLRPFRTAVEQRDFVAAGGASGVAAAFGAPVGGVLFCIEEGASHMNPAIMMRTFVAAVFSALTTRFFLKDGPWGTMGAVAPLSFGYFDRENYEIWELGLWTIMGSVGGLLGAFFNGSNTALTKWRMKHKLVSTPWKRFLEVIIVTTTISMLYFMTPPVVNSIYNTGSGTKMANFTSAEKLFWQPGEESIRSLFHDTENFDPGLLTFFALSYFCLACWTYGLGVPSGLFVPSLLAGAAFGRLFGQFLNNHGITETHAGIYALIGATAFLSGMARITISLAVILMEASGSTVWAIPIFMTVLASKWTGDRFNEGLYDIHIHLKHVPILEIFPEKEMIEMRARDVMNKEVMAVERVETVADLVKILSSCKHSAFPVLHHEHKNFIGMVKRDVIHSVLYDAKKFGSLQPAGDHLTSRPIIPYEEFMKWHPSHPSLDDISNVLTEADYACKIDLGPYMNRGGYTVPEYAALTRIYMLFRTMGLRHLPVVSHNGDVVGTITRKDLIMKHEEITSGHATGNSVAPMQSFTSPSFAGNAASGARPRETTSTVTTSHSARTVTRRESVALPMPVDGLVSWERGAAAAQPERAATAGRRRSLAAGDGAFAGLAGLAAAAGAAPLLAHQGPLPGVQELPNRKESGLTASSGKSDSDSDSDSDSKESK